MHVALLKESSRHHLFSMAVRRREYVLSPINHQLQLRCLSALSFPGIVVSEAERLFRWVE